MIQDRALFLRGISEFQSGEYYRCHDSLEELWMDAQEPEKTFIQGILQVAVGCYHLSNGNAKGSMILLGEGIKRLKGYQPDFESVDVQTLVQTSATFLGTIQQLDDAMVSEAALWLQSRPSSGEHWQASSGDMLTLPVLNTVNF